MKSWTFLIMDYIGGLVFFLFGAMMIYDFVLFYEQKDVKTTVGKVIRLNVKTDEKGQEYNPVFAYQTEDGTPYEYNCTYNFTSRKPMFSEILYMMVVILGHYFIC
jgi:hypothetical protein